MPERHSQNLADNTVLQAAWIAINGNDTINQEPYPDFDLEINKEDKDQDLEHPKIRKNQEDEEKKDDSRTNPPPTFKITIG